MNSMNYRVRIGSDVEIAPDKGLVVFCGPCVIESREHALEHAEEISRICRETGVQLVYKSSYDKANRTSASSFRGLGLEEGLQILEEVREKFGCPVVTDVHSPQEAKTVGAVADVVQVPAFLCRQTDLLIAAGESGKPVLVKKGQFVHPQDMKFCAEKIRQTGNHSVLLCERGSSFGYRELVVDFRSLEWMREIAPVVYDATHSVQIMGGAGGTSSGHRRFVSSLARAAVAVGVDAVFLEAHRDPDRAPSDGPNMLPLTELGALLRDLQELRRLSLQTR